MKQSLFKESLKRSIDFWSGDILVWMKEIKENKEQTKILKIELSHFKNWLEDQIEYL